MTFSAGGSVGMMGAVAQTVSHVQSIQYIMCQVHLHVHFMKLAAV